MAGRLVLALAQLNPTVGDIPGNLGKLKEVWREAERQAADLVVTPELYLSGYPPEDFALNPSLLKTVEGAVKGWRARPHQGPPYSSARRGWKMATFTTRRCYQTGGMRQNLRRPAQLPIAPTSGPPAAVGGPAIFMATARYHDLQDM